MENVMSVEVNFKRAIKMGILDKALKTVKM